MATKKTLSFDVWMAKVDAAIERLTGGFNSEDLPDFCYKDFYNAGDDHLMTAKQAIEYAEEY